MNTERLIERMETFPAALEALLRNVSAVESRWRPADGQWSIVEIVNHLWYEETQDFRPRMRLTIEDPKHPWPPIDPGRAVVEGAFQERELGPSIGELGRERRTTIVFLRGVRRIDLDRTHHHPKLGAISAGDLFASFAAHDALHLRQLSRRLFELVQRDGSPWTPAYAGSWPGST